MGEEEKAVLAVEAFFKLIRLGIGVGKDKDIVLDAEGWKRVFDMACKQSLTAIVLDGVHCLGVACKPPSDILLPWIMLTQRIEVRNRQLNRQAAKVCAKFRELDMEPIILKGQGNALLYPNPLHRVSGDIDLWVKGKRKDVVAYVRKYFPDEEVVYHHMTFPALKDTEVELHFTPSWMNQWRINHRLQHYFTDWRPLSAANRVKLPDQEEGDVSVPTLAMNRVYLLCHIYRHLFDEGVGLRQLLDYYFVLSQPYTEMARDETVWVLRRLHMTRFAGAVMYVLQTVFGLDDDHLLVPALPKQGTRLLSEIMRAGNIGKFDDRIHRVEGETFFHRFCRKLGRNFGFLSDYPGEVLWTPMFKIWHFTWRSYHGYLPKSKK